MMKNYAIICVVIGVMSSALVADSLRINSFLDSGPCPDDFTGLIPNPEDCHSFYICDAGIPGLITCPADLCFGPHDACDHCELVPGCESGTVPVTSTTGSPSSSSTTEPEPSTTTPTPTTTSAPPDTTTTRATSTAAPTSTSAPPDTTTTRATSTAAPTSTSAPPDTTTTRATSTAAPTSTSTPRTTTSSGELSCPPDIPYIYMPYPGDCNKFYYCQEGINTGIYNCGLNLWFNFRQQACTLPWGESCEIE